jgi:hypothetical protein
MMERNTLGCGEREISQYIAARKSIMSCWLVPFAFCQHHWRPLRLRGGGHEEADEIATARIGSAQHEQEEEQDLKTRCHRIGLLSISIMLWLNLESWFLIHVYFNRHQRQNPNFNLPSKEKPAPSFPPLRA